MNAFGDVEPKREGLRIPRRMVEEYGFGVFVNYPHDEFKQASLEEFGEYPVVKEAANNEP